MWFPLNVSKSSSSQNFELEEPSVISPLNYPPKPYFVEIVLNHFAYPNMFYLDWKKNQCVISHSSLKSLSGSDVILSCKHLRFSKCRFLEYLKELMWPKSCAFDIANNMTDGARWKCLMIRAIRWYLVSAKFFQNSSPNMLSN